MTGQLIITAPAFQSPPLLCIHFGLKEEHGEGAEIIVNPCFDAPSPLPRCCLNMSLFCPPHFLFQPESLSLICKCCRPHPPTPPHPHTANYFGLQRGISIVVILLQFPCYLHYSCVLWLCVCVCERVGKKRESEKVEVVDDENHRANSNHNNNTITNITWYQLQPQLYS